MYQKNRNFTESESKDARYGSRKVTFHYKNLGFQYIVCQSLYNWPLSRGYLQLAIVKRLLWLVEMSFHCGEVAAVV